MAGTAQRTDPALWDKVKDQVTKGDKGGNAGQWSARKAQLAVSEYKKAGGGYRGKKDPENHLAQWTHEKWGTKSGEESLKSGERYLPQQAREKLTDDEYKRTTAKKRADTRRGKQFSGQPKDVAKKVAGTHLAELPVAELRKRAAAKSVAGRSRMSKDKLIEALS
jgi:hypothetical protein